MEHKVMNEFLAFRRIQFANCPSVAVTLKDEVGVGLGVWREVERPQFGVNLTKQWTF
jgi:hypothetical protein